ncbi:MAG: hypothetical protein K5685_07310 [Bacteroidales bacterium]|nr:hypothetical protein [Bacteroidales bacterium]
MILKQLKQNGIEGLIISFLIIGLMIVSMFYPAAMQHIEMPQNGTLLFNSLYEKFFGGISSLTQIVSLFLMAIEITLVVLMNLNNELTRAKSTVFILILSMVSLSYIPHNTLLPEQVANIFITLGIIKVLSSHSVDNAEFMFFDAGLFFGIAALFCIPAAFLLIIGIIALIIYRPYRFSEFAVYLIGFCTPVLFYVSGYYYFESTMEPIWDSYKEAFQAPFYRGLEKPQIISFGLYFVMIASASVFLLQEYPKYNLFASRTYKMFFIFFVLTLLLAASPYFSVQVIRLAVTPLTMLYVTVFNNFPARRTLFAEIFFAMFIVVYMGVQALWFAA